MEIKANVKGKGRGHTMVDEAGVGLEGALKDERECGCACGDSKCWINSCIATRVKV